MRTIPMQYFGYGSARIIMPRTVVRRARREWIVSPTFMILIISMSFFTAYKIIFNAPLKLNRTQTIILLPQTPVVPEPTVEKKLTFFKVVKDAAKKSAEPRKKELKQVKERKQAIAPPKPRPKKPLPPVAVKPRTPPLRQVPPVKKQLALPPKALPPPTLPNRPLPQNAPLKPVKPKSLAPMKHAPDQLKTAAPERLAANTPPPRKKVRAVPVSKPQHLKVASRRPVDPAKIPEAEPLRKNAPALQAATPSAPAPQKAQTPRPLPAEAPPQKRFTPMALSDAPGRVATRQQDAPPSGAVAVAPKRTGPAPGLTQLSAPSALPAAPSGPTGEAAPAKAARRSGPSPSLARLSAPSALAAAPEGETVQPRAARRPDRPSLQAAPALLASAPSGPPSQPAAPDIHSLVTIEGSTLTHSLRVTSLKEEIYRKARYMSPEKSPYTYRIQGYTCTVVIAGGAIPTATLSFQPNDATFEVVSALERALPRRTM